MKMLLGLLCILITLSFCLFHGSMATIGFIKFSQDFKLGGITDNGIISNEALYLSLVINIILGTLIFYFVVFPAIIHRLDLWKWLDRSPRIQKYEIKIMEWFADNFKGYVESIRKYKAHKESILEMNKTH